MERLIVYIDGFNLYHGLHEWCKRRALWLDVVALSQSLRPASQILAVKYFTAPVLDQPAALSRQAIYLDALQVHCGPVLSITQGRYQSKIIKCRKCGGVRTHYEEKETDVNIAVNIVADAATGIADSALIVSADSDLVPAIKTARRLNPKMFIAAAFPPARFSAHLKTLMPSSFSVSKAKINGAQLPDIVVDASNNRTLTRPAHWS